MRDKTLKNKRGLILLPDLFYSVAIPPIPRKTLDL